ncbi:strawberry notch C-terminal domain-containing protein [uncultured Duncaniella sp.]|uniref:strawberry notch C-terminal domain-containing protein n=1 Tax=uncultured Duncaniella sp. TaxID=2768039 RepID=UPI0026F3B00C|nr:strawberry notch C-terminal domain-containing protein [uncultured Duncaniella sp.]
MANESTKWLYDQLKGKGYNVGKDVNEFDSLMRSNAESRKWAYETATKSGLNVGKDIDEFSTLVGGVTQTAAPAPASPVEDVKPTQQPTQQPAKPKQQQTWQPTPMQKAFMSHAVQSQLDRFKATSDAIMEQTQNTMDYYRKGGGITGGPVKGKMRVNKKSGKVEQTYLTPTGTATADKAAAERETRAFNEYVDNMTVAGQLRRAGRDLQELHRKREARAKAIHDEWAEDYKNNTAPLAAVLSAGTYRPSIEGDQEYRALTAAIHQAEKRVQTLQHENDRQQGKDVGFWRGFGEVVGDIKTWDFGYSGLMDAMTMLDASKPSPKARPKTEAQKAAQQTMLEQTAEAQAAQAAYGQNDSFWNRAGVMTGEMLPFMLDFALMGGSNSGTSAVTRTIDAALLKTLRSAAPKVARNKAAQWTVKALGAMPEDLLYRAPLMTNTVQGMKTASDIIDRKLGDVVVREDGTYDFSNDRSWGSAIWQGEANAIIENYSEMFGTHLEGVLSLNTLGKIADTFGAKRLSGILAKASNSELAGIAGTMQKHLNQLGVSDYFGEVGEEYYGQLWRTMLNLDDAYKQNPDGTRTNLFLDGQFHGDIWGGMALSMGLMGAGKYTLSAAAYGSMKHNVNKTDARASEIFTPDVWDGWRARIDGTTNADIGAMAESIISDTSLTPEQKSAAMNYMEASLNLRGFNLASIARQRGGEQTAEEAAANESYMDGYAATTPQEMNDAKRMLDLQRQRLAASLSDDMVHEYDADPIGALSRTADPELRRIAADYVNAKQVYDGMIQRVRDDVDARIAQSDAMIDSRANRETGMIQPATMKIDDRPVYIVNGNITMYDDGTGVDLDNSSESIIIRDAETGKIEFADPSQVLNIGEGIDAETEKEAARNQITQEVAQAAANNIDGVLSFAPGETYSVLDIDGNEEPISILGQAADEDGNPLDGYVDIQYGDGTIQSVATSDLQQWVDAANDKRVAQFAEERVTERAAADEAERQADETGLSNPNRDRSLLPDNWEMPYYGFNTTASRYIESERGTGGILYQDEQGNDAIVVSAIDDHNYVGYFREYDEQGNPTNRWSAKFQNGSGLRENHRDMMQTAQELLPAGHELTEHKSVSTDGLRNLANQLKHGYELQYDEEGNVITNRVAVNMMARENDLGLPQSYFRPGSEANVRIRLEDDERADVNARLAQFLAPFGLDESAIHWEGNKLYVDHPVLRRADTPQQEEAPGVPETADSVPNTAETGENGGQGVPKVEKFGDGGIIITPDIALSEEEVEAMLSGETAPATSPATAETAETAPEEQQPSALSQIPTDEKGDPIYEQADPGTAWDALLEETEDEQIAQNVIAQEIAEREDALKKLEKQKPKAGLSTREKIQAEKDKKKAMDDIRKSIDHWKRMSATKQRRQAEADAIRNEEARRRAEERRTQEAQARAEREEAERKEREALNGVPDWSHDTPQDARARGYRRFGPEKVDRQEPVTAVTGKDVEVKFGESELPKGKAALIPISSLQPSHIEGMRNPRHFLDEAQPKERTDAPSREAARKIASNIRPEEITSSVTAYTGAPTVNSRGETIQGNSRSAALRAMYESYPEQAAKYRQYLIDHAADFGLTPEQVEGMENPVLVNMLDVADDEAIRLGQFVAQDTESGGIERIKPKNAVKKMGAKIRNFANILLRSSDDEASLSQLVDSNGIDVLKWMAQQGFISDTQYASAFDSKGNLTGEASNDLKGILYQSIFTGGSTRLEEMFNQLPSKAQRAILATAFRDYDSSRADRMVEEIQQSIMAYSDMMQYEPFASATNIKDATGAMESWKRQYAMDDVTGEPYLPAEKFSNFALALAAIYKGASQRFIQQTFNDLYDTVQGTAQDTLFEEADKTPKPLAEAIKKVLDLEYQPIKQEEKNDNGEHDNSGSDAVDLDTPQSEAGRPGSDGNAENGEREPDGGRTADSGDGASAESGAGNEVAPTPASEQSEDSLFTQEEIKAICGHTFKHSNGDVVKLTGHTTLWDGRPAFIGTLNGAKGGRFMHNLVRVMLDKWEHDVNLPAKQETAPAQAQEKPTTAQQESSAAADEEADEEALLSRMDIQEDDWEEGEGKYPTHKRTIIIDGKHSVIQVDAPNAKGEYTGSTYEYDGKSFSDLREVFAHIDSHPTLGQKIEEAEAEVNTNPTEGQKEAGNYKKGHVQVGTFDVTIENPKGSKRSGTDADGKKWETTMTHTYGYIRGTKGVDGDHIDVYISSEIDDWNGREAFVVDQYNPDGTFDEHKVMLGFNDRDEAFSAYLSNYESGWEKGRRLDITAVPIEEFEKWIESSKRKTKPFAEYKSVRTEENATANEGKDTLHDEVREWLGKKGLEPTEASRSAVMRYFKIGYNRAGKILNAIAEENATHEDTTPAQEDTAATSGEGYSIVSKPYTNKQGKTLDTHLVTFDRDFTKEEQKRIRSMAKEKKGWQDRETGGFMLRSREDAEAFAASVMAINTTTTADAPVSLSEIESAIKPTEAETSTSETEISAPETDKTGTETEISSSPEEKPSDSAPKPGKKKSKWVDDEDAAEFERLRKIMREGLGQLNMGFPPELLYAGAKMSYLMMKHGVRKFAEYATAMIEELGDAIRPHLKALYNFTRSTDEVTSSDWANELTPFDEVMSFDTQNFDKSHVDAMATAENVVAEEESQQHLEDTVSTIKETIRQNPDGTTSHTVIEGGTEIEVTQGDFIPGVYPAVNEPKKPGKKKTAKPKPETTGQLDLFGEEDEQIINDVIEETAPPEPKPEAELSGDSADYQERSRQERDLVDDIIVEIMKRTDMKERGDDRGALTMRDIRGMLENYDLLTDISATDLQELVERAMTILTRTAAKANQADPRKGYDRVVGYYNMQPSLNARDSERLIKQQYSTPTPFGYVMGQFVNANNDAKSILEPSAGNGALTIMFDPATVHVNDIDERRLENLRTLGYGKVTAQNGLLPFEGEQVDGVLTNPPFGTVAERVYDGIFKISSLEGQMAINALDSMKDGGRAAIIIGGNTSYRTNGSMNPKDAAFFGYLYSHYNVVDVINISGKALYARNGTGYDVRMILINGRKTGEFSRVYPPVKSKARAEQVTTFDELYKRVQDDIQQVFQMGHKPADVQPEAGATADGGTSAPVRSGNNRPNKGAGERPGSTGNGSGSASGSHIEQPSSGNAGGRPAGVDNGNTGNAGGTDNVQKPKPATPGSNGSGSAQNDGGRSGGNGRDATSSRPNSGGERLAVKPDLTTEKVPYPNQSDNGFTLLSVVPAAQAEVLQRSLGEIGDVDQFLVDELGYSSKEELYGFLAAEQIDSVALAIHQMNKGNAFIIGDMTGVGKGRQGAALIRYGVRQGRCPIYFTQKPTLFTDNYRDLADIGSSELRPFIIASNPKDANIVDNNGNVVHKLPSKKEQERVFNYIMENGKLPEEYDYVLTTYDQIKNGTADYTQNEDGTWNTEARKLPKKSKGYTTADHNGQARRDALARLAMGTAPGQGNIAILDESHTVGGDSGCGRYMQMLTSGAYGVTFLSATFAKRADNMPIYAQRTAIAEAGVNARELIEAIAKGGVTLQEIMSKQLVESGQMIRRERSFEGVTIDWLSVGEETDRKQREQFNEVANIFNSIRNFQNDFIKPIIDGMNEAAAEQGATVGQTQGTKDLGVRNTPFASKMYNLVNQLLFALKVDAVADRVIENLRNGFKPVISFTNTMEGFLASAPKGVAMDEVPNFSLTLMRALDGVMRFTENDADQNSEGGQITLSQLSPDGQKAYNEVKEKIMNLSADLPISPMDAIRMKIEEAGYSVAEITGRTTQLNRTEDGRYIVEGRKDRDKKAAMRDFNSGKLDVLMINKSGSTGISLHASSKFEDQRQRVMVFAQFQSDINDEVQMRGRIDRSGQVVRGRYEYIMSTIPAEQRIQMMFKAKLKSLDANTTSSQKSKFNEMEIVDYLNKYGDEVVWEYMKEHPELSDRLGGPLKMLQDKGEDGAARTSENEDNSQKSDCAGKISRYLAFLSVEEQDEIFKEITEAYKVKIQLLDDAGENDLEITTMPLRAETKSKQIWHRGENPGSGNAFADNTYVEEVEVDVLKKPMKRTEIEDMTRKLMGDKAATATEYDQTRYGMKEGELNWGRYADTMIEEINSFFNAKADDAVEKMIESGDKRVAKAREKAVKDALKARAKGENTFSDQEIQSLADVVAKEAADREEMKQYRRREEINAVRDHIKRLLSRLRAGHIYVVPQDLKQATADMFAQTFGTFVGFKFNKSYTLGSSTAIFATLDGRRKVELALNDKAIETIIRCTETALRYSPKEINAISMDNWDSKVPTQTRQKRYIITGNLLQALVDTEKGERTKGNLISFSTLEGDTRQGILMSENFKPTDLRSSVPLRSRLKQIQDGMTVVSENGDVQIERVDFDWKHRGEYELRVPKSKQRGGIYSMNTELLKLIDGHNFNSKGNSMVGYVLPENLAKVVDLLSRAPFNLTVLEESKLEESKTEDEDIRFRIREDEPPKQTGVGYKVFVLKDGKLYPPMVANPNGEATPVGVWLDADAAPVAGTSKTGRMQVKAGGKGTQGGSGKLAYRPGWHLGVIPYALQFNRKGESGEKELFPANFVWAEVEYANDIDYQEEAMSYGYNKNGKFQHSYAGLPRLPINGAYKYRTNPNPETDPWIITGAMKVNRLLTPTEVDDMVRAAGREPQKRQEGAITDEQINELNAQLEQREREGDGAYSDAELSYENDPWSKAFGESIRTKKKQVQFAERMRKVMRERVNKLSETLGVDIELVEDGSALKGKKKKAKGWYDTKTGKITIVLGNHKGTEDIEATILHEVVAHHGLRELFG